MTILDENYCLDVLFVRTSARVRVYPADAVLSMVKIASARTREKNKNKNKLNFFLAVVAGLERDTIYNLQFTVFGFQSPKSQKSPNSLSSAGFTGEAARRRRFFRPSSPNHPSKLYSSLGWLNSKVPKPFPPFSLRLIDVDGF
jgi:hypothetical protein